MRHFPSDKYTIAWFKLADCISRGEKERALGVYRLLAHSFDDPALAMQLEGDIHYAFQDQPRAVEKYREAAQLYCQQERLLDAASMYELLIDLEADKRPAISMLIDLYRALGNTARLTGCLQELCLYELDKGNVLAIEQILEDVVMVAPRPVIIDVRRHMLYAAIKDGRTSFDFVVRQSKKLVDDLTQSDDPKELPAFLTYLEQAHPACYEAVQEHLRSAH